MSLRQRRVRILALAALLVFVFTLASVLPRYTAATPTKGHHSGTSSVYRAAIPGPGSDPGGAAWQVVTPDTTMTRCGTSILLMMVAGQQQGVIAFTPPGGVFPPRYSVAVRAALSALSDGCIALATRVSAAADVYLYSPCVDGEWCITLDGQTDHPLAGGTVAAA